MVRANCRPPRTSASGPKTCRPPRTSSRASISSLASHDPGFGTADNVVQLTDVWVSDLGHWSRGPQPRSTNIEGFVLQANSGEPSKGPRSSSGSPGLQQVHGTGPHGQDRPQRTLLLPRPQSAACGAGHLQGPAVGRRRRLFGLFGQRPLALRSKRSSSPTARSIVPGQTIQYKGSRIAVDQEADNYKASAAAD